MSKTALYQKYRSASFDEVVGQEVTVRTIKNAIREDKVGHAYLFCGPRGTGKTTMARLLAKAVNCTDHENAPCGKCDNCISAANGTHPDIIEINAANETHVEDIRDLIERSKLAPMFGKHKVYIIDEVHQLSSAASSALLKTLEEPPENVIFILATTDPQKLLPTIISRCQQFNFFKIRTDQIQNHLLEIAEKENIKMDVQAAYQIAVLANGGMRDALSIMDQCASFSNDEIKEEDIERIYGLTSLQEQVSLLKDIFHQELSSVLSRIRQYEDHGIDVSRMTDSIIDVLKDAVIYRYTKKEDILKVLTKEQADSVSSEKKAKEMLKMIDILMEGKNKYKIAQNAFSAFEVVCLQMIAEEDQPAEIVEKPVKKQVKKEYVQEEPSYNEEEPDPIEIPKAKEPVIKAEVKPAISREDVLGLMQIMNKDEKKIDQEKFMTMNLLSGLEVAKYKTMLKGAMVASSGPQAILIAVKESAGRDRLNHLQDELHGFLKGQLNIDKIPFVITIEEFNECAKEFRIRMKDNTLPPPYVIKQSDTKMSEEMTSEQKVLDLFGTENVKVI